MNVHEYSVSQGKRGLGFQSFIENKKHLTFDRTGSKQEGNKHYPRSPIIKITDIQYYNYDQQYICTDIISKKN